MSLDAIPDVVLDVRSDIAADAELNGKPAIPWVFNVEGTFLGLLGEPPEHVTAIVLDVDQEKMAIALPDHLCNAVKHSVRRRTLRLGDRVRCIGRSRLDFPAGVIQLKAYCLFTDTQQRARQLNTVEEQNLLVKESSPPLSQSASTVLIDPNQQRGKIMVCHKSGCRKRGGRQLVEALERTLREKQLEAQVEIQYTGCQKCCSKAPGLTIMPGRHRYDGLSPADVPNLLDKHFSP
jgi:(2Fe-2S) ferredoxin